MGAVHVGEHSMRFDGTHAFDMGEMEWMGTSGVLGVHPNGTKAYVASSITSILSVLELDVQSDCAVTSNGIPTLATTNDAPTGLLVDATRTHLYTLGHQVTPFALRADGHVTGPRPVALMQDQTFSGGALAVDPTEPERLYITGPGFRDPSSMMSGVLPAQIAANGSLTAGAAAYFILPGQVPGGLALAP